MRGKLILCGTPIGNLEDVSERAKRVLSEADVIACEDTRRTRKLLSHLGIAARGLVVYNEATERRQAHTLVDVISKGQVVVLVSDAGMPGLSDPGFRLVRECADRGIAVEVVPGPNAAVSALAISGIAPGRFVFEGFLPRRSSERKRHVMDLIHEPRTLVFYESPHRIEACLSDLAEVLGATRPAALARELTKMHEEVRRGTLGELLDSVTQQPPRGEMVIVVEGAVHEHKSPAAPEELAARARELMGTGVPRAEALQTVAKTLGVPRREVFDALLKHP
jgi:16S rRNA (cytidine1402-2'-O)-methyltransferase